MKIYCQKCGNGTEYSFDKPKFCSGCGLNFSIASSHIPKIIKPEITIPNKNNKERLNKLNLSVILALLDISGNWIAPRIRVQKIHIINIIQIEEADVVLSLKNPPG